MINSRRNNYWLSLCGTEGGDQTSWDDPLNWDTDSLPQNGDDVVIEGTTETIVFEETLSLNSFSTTTSLTLNDGDLTVTDDVSVSAGSTILADGPFAKFQAANTAAVNGASLVSQAGGEIIFDNLTAYAHSTGSAENLATFEATGTDSLIDLRGITNLSNGAGERDILSIKATDGGLVDLRSVTNVSTPVGSGAQESYIEIIADGALSEVDLSSLLSFSGNAQGVNLNRIESINAGLIDAGSASVLQNAEVITDTPFFSPDNGVSLLGEVNYQSSNSLVINSLFWGQSTPGFEGNFDIDAPIDFGENATLRLDALGELSVSGDVSFAGTSTFVQLDGVLRLDGNSDASDPQTVEVYQADDGPNGFNNFLPTFNFRTLELGDTTYVQLLDTSDNRANGLAEALYVDDLQVPTNATLDLNGLNAYTIFGSIAGTTVNGDVTFDDIAPTVDSIVGLPDEGTSSPDILNSFTVNFSERINPATLLAPGAFQLREAGADGRFGTRDDTATGLVNTTTPNEFSTSISFATADGQQLASGDYRLRLFGIEDRFGNSLDGNGDGTGGDFFERTFTMFVKDFGDAPAPYPTLLSDNGAHHEAIGPSLGGRTTELDGNPSDMADGDVEDGLSFYDLNVGTLGGGVNVNVTNAPDGAFLDAWIDFNQDGDWDDAGEQIFTSKLVLQGNNNLRFDIPLTNADTTIFSRFRISTQGSLGTTGDATDGEVEDHQLTIAPIYTWDGGGDGFTWQDAANWENDILPGSDLNIYIPDVRRFNTIQINDDVTINGLISEKSLNLNGDSVLTTPQGNYLVIDVAGNFTIRPEASIDLNAKGFIGGLNGTGGGPGGGSYGRWGAPGASHGGRGGSGSSAGSSASNGSATQPFEMALAEVVILIVEVEVVAVPFASLLITC